MSENEQSAETKVRFIIEKNTKEEELLAENQQLKDTMTEMASIEFAKQCQAYGLDPSTSSSYDLERAKAERNLSPKDLHGQSGETAMLNRNQITGQTTYHLDPNSDLPISMISCEAPEELIAIAEKKAKLGDSESQQILNKLTSKMVRSGKGLSMEFNGNIRDFSRSPLATSQFMDETEKARREKINEYLKNNRCNWKETRDW